MDWIVEYNGESFLVLKAKTIEHAIAKWQIAQERDDFQADKLSAYPAARSIPAKPSEEVFKLHADEDL